MDTTTIVGFALTLAGLCIGIIQLKRAKAVNKRRLVFDISKEFFGDDDIRRFFYKIDYSEFAFNRADFRGSPEERWLDAILYRCDIIGSMVRSKVLLLSEVEIFLFEMVQVYKNVEVQKYLDWLDTEFKAYGKVGKNERKRAHDDFRWIVEKIKK